jgi:diguanylate cyclase (GGDEF)-like protein
MMEEFWEHAIFWVLEVILCGTLGVLIYKISTLKRSRENAKTKEQALLDPLTKRGNRHLFLSIMDTLVKKGKKFAVCFMDLDGFKQINDTMGHDAGDELLIYLANTFAEKLPSNAIAYRLGGDEFAIIIQNISTTADISNLLDNLKKDLQVPVKIGDASISLEYSLGVAIYPDDATTRQDLTTYADDAMYYIKEHGKNSYYFHNKALKAQLENRTKMESDLKKAYENNEFGISLQPRINIKDTSKICFEALLYWNHPVLGKLKSEYFIKQAEDMALTIKLDQYTLDAACKMLNSFVLAGHKDVQIAVNISNRHATRKEFVDKLCETLEENMIDKSSIQIEIIDTININKIEIYKTMFERLKQAGADIITNNLEIKYDSISLFPDLPIDEMKLFCNYISKNSNLNEDIFKNIIKLSQNLNYSVIIDRIETEDELIESLKNGANKLQGDFLFKKMEFEDARTYVENYKEYKSKIDNIIKKVKGI